MEETESALELSELHQAAPQLGEQRVRQADPNNRLIVPDVLFSQTMNTLEERSAGWRESAAIWAGKIVDEVDWVVEHVFYHHELCDDHAGALFLELSESAKFHLYKHLAQENLRLVALIHTHPKTWVDLSQTDRSNQLSSRIGFWSIVVPWYGRQPWKTTKMGVHIRAADGWLRLNKSATTRRFIVEK